ncbi:uncharacterized protein MYCFIDRAFT_214688 [Pseudocercospora fijiensis CIRAD86]|uniref:Uncharacterized protein n=1 Tax=Pseudocercospora fijiensis (strain CIRAD86) TaxID=383855 RepID=M2Z3A8_PSEFD|nr:uncharacterized protein MYCFIDRAFT_214688 [Pseudocercospora fijiensis CIRAD86]EME84305.1 hypothetical protein MYCFIDRAFT_214688 [Pseudocercospora fijiensis CIRAD86]
MCMDGECSSQDADNAMQDVDQGSKDADARRSQRGKRIRLHAWKGRLSACSRGAVLSFSTTAQFPAVPAFVLCFRAPGWWSRQAQCTEQDAADAREMRKSAGGVVQVSSDALLAQVGGMAAGPLYGRSCMGGAVWRSGVDGAVSCRQLTEEAAGVSGAKRRESAVRCGAVRCGAERCGAVLVPDQDCAEWELELELEHRPSPA